MTQLENTFKMLEDAAGIKSQKFPELAGFECSSFKLFAGFVVWILLMIFG